MKKQIRAWHVAAGALCALIATLPAAASTIANAPFTGFAPGNLVLARTVYDNNAANVSVGQQLPPGCAPANCGSAVADGTFPYIFNNSTVDGSFGITSPIFLDQLTPGGSYIDTLALPDQTTDAEYIVTSYSSKSELALNLSTDGKFVTFMGYGANPYQLDVSNGNTPGVNDPSNADPVVTYRGVGQIDASGNLKVTLTNAYTGDNGRAAIFNEAGDVYYTAGNASGSLAGVIAGAGAQIITPSGASESVQSPGFPTPLASFNVTEVPGNNKDKFSKDNNYRSVTIYNNVVYYAKGSGGNGVNTVYYVDPSQTTASCPNGAGLPASDAALPTTALAYSGNIAKKGLPNSMCILKGFPTTSAKQVAPVNFPFAIWFASPTTLYVADEGDGFAGDGTLYSHAAAQTNAGLEKWVFNSSMGEWQMAYVLQNGLNLGQPYAVTGYPTGSNEVTGLPWAPAIDGVRQITGRVNADGTATIWATTSTVSGSGDQGADPNKLVAITDSLFSTDPAIAATEQFHTLRSAGLAELFRGVSLTPGTNVTAPAILNYSAVVSGVVYNRFKHSYGATVTVRNNTASILNGPVWLTFPGLNGTLAGGVTYNGSQAIAILGGTSLEPGGSMKVGITVTGVTGAPILNPVVVKP